VFLVNANVAESFFLEHYTGSITLRCTILSCPLSNPLNHVETIPPPFLAYHIQARDHSHAAIVVTTKMLMSFVIVVIVVDIIIITTTTGAMMLTTGTQ
jgi:hypothetical protein